MIFGVSSKASERQVIEPTPAAGRLRLRVEAAASLPVTGFVHTVPWPVTHTVDSWDVSKIGTIQGLGPCHRVVAVLKG